MKKFLKTAPWSRNITMSFHININVAKLKRIKACWDFQIEQIWEAERIYVYVTPHVIFTNGLTHMKNALRSTAYLHRYMHNLLAENIFNIKSFRYLLWLVEGPFAQQKHKYTKENNNSGLGTIHLPFPFFLLVRVQ